jgi:hypothetical protein
MSEKTERETTPCRACRDAIRVNSSAIDVADLPGTGDRHVHTVEATARVAARARRLLD